MYDGDVPTFEISSFVNLFDADGDGRISFEEFLNALGAKSDEDGVPSTLLSLPSPDDSPQPTLDGTVLVTLDDGSEVSTTSILPS